MEKIAIVDDNKKSAKEIGEEFRRLYTTSNHHAINSMINSLHPLFVDEKNEN